MSHTHPAVMGFLVRQAGYNAATLQMADSHLNLSTGTLVMTSTASSRCLNLPLLSRPMIALMSAQFLSALADNAILLACLKLIALLGQADSSSYLKMMFIIPFILLAPFVGPFADCLPKGRVMMFGNTLKLFGSILLVLGFDPWLSFGIVGLGACVYSPAKYGILSQMFSPQNLVKANGLVEASTIIAILIGMFVGGLLLSIWNMQGTLIAITGIYLLAAVANLFIDRIEPEHPLQLQWLVWLKDFMAGCRQLARHPDGQFSLIGTAICWSFAHTLQIMLVAWIPVALLAYLNQGHDSSSVLSYLLIAVSIGIVPGAWIAGRFIKLEDAHKALYGGWILGSMLFALSFSSNFYLSFILLMLVGLGGGILVVPLNALLQEVGHRQLGAGKAIAVQNLAENAATLALLGLYQIVLEHWGVIRVGQFFGTIVLLSMFALHWSHRNRKHISFDD